MLLRWLCDSVENNSVRSYYFCKVNVSSNNSYPEQVQVLHLINYEIGLQLLEESYIFFLFYKHGNLLDKSKVHQSEILFRFGTPDSWGLLGLSFKIHLFQLFTVCQCIELSKVKLQAVAVLKNLIWKFMHTFPNDVHLIW